MHYWQAGDCACKIISMCNVTVCTVPVTNKYTEKLACSDDSFCSPISVTVDDVMWLVIVHTPITNGGTVVPFHCKTIALNVPPSLPPSFLLYIVYPSPQLYSIFNFHTKVCLQCHCMSRYRGRDVVVDVPSQKSSTCRIHTSSIDSDWVLVWSWSHDCHMTCLWINYWPLLCCTLCKYFHVNDMYMYF